ncbi:sugar ABC transporter ATP-binding protein [Streptomyces sp. GS7]|uniref:sugar ABC transporter ATP-binding protein n=1 Tax=Streptomyces sp. GS7 TaxID=2692234 RepID=UPI0013182DA1|nr:sugar ABC transporter ATP-binding protein [Streptomyces sp. GS7]QHC21999.1 ATP-binding cassette domain-containing protein [Streptomyces sp. GS7]
MEQPVVHAEGIVKRYGPTVALDGARLTVRPGEAHALVGRNGAGKSTLVSVLTGMERPDAGRVAFGGEPAPGWGDTAAWRRRVACVYQKSMTVPELTVAENLYLNRFQEAGGRAIRWRALRERARALLAEYGVDVDPGARIRELGVEQRQFVEIARALSCGARLIVLDEPTARLDAAGIARLFGKLRELRAQGAAFLFISHHLQEVYELCDTVTVLRDARRVLTAPVAGLPEDALVAAMTGEEAGAPRTVRTAAGPAGEPVLRAEGLALAGRFGPLDLTVRAGEVVGLAGAAASGSTAIGEALAGLRAPDAGRIAVRGRPVRNGSVPHALDAGIGYVPEDRHREGLVPGRSVAENATLTVTGRLGPLGTVLPSRTREFARRMIASLDIKTTGPGQPVSGLSGGNQQKVVIARALARDPAVLVAVRPTNGVDVRSRDALLGVVRQVADAGSGALIVSDELDDLRVCDRVLAVFHGRVTAAFGPGWRDHELVAAMEGMAADGPPAGEGGASARGPSGTSADTDGTADSADNG